MCPAVQKHSLPKTFVYTDSREVAHKIPVWLHFCLKATEDGAVIIGELFAGPIAKRSSESKQKKSL